MPGLSTAFYIIVIVTLIIIITRTGKIHISGTMVCLYVACLLSILSNNIPAFFNAYQRFALFVIMTLLLSPALVSDVLLAFRFKLLHVIVYFLKYVVLFSFIFGIAHIGYENIYFKGITKHSMLLGPFAAVCILYCLCIFLRGDLENKKKILYSTLLLASLYCLLQAASRTAFIACAVSAIILLTVYYRKNFGKYFRIISILGISLALSYPLWNQYLDKLIEKNQGNMTSLSVDSREVLWQARIKEFKNNPVMGIGFSTVDMNNKEGSTYSSDGKVETGSSWLCALSMTGILGFIPLCIVFWSVLVSVWRLCDYIPLLSSFLIALQCFWILHMMTEGYIYAGGSSLFFCLWLLLGVMNGLHYNLQLANIMQGEIFK